MFEDAIITVSHRKGIGGMSTKAMVHSRLALSPSEAALAIGISRNKMYDLLKTDGFPCKHIGGRIVIPVEALKRWLENGDSHEALL